MMGKREIMGAFGVLLGLGIFSFFMMRPTYDSIITNSDESRVVTFNHHGHIENTDAITITASSALPFTVTSRRYADRKYSSHVSSAGYEYGVLTLQPDYWDIHATAPILVTVFTQSNRVKVTEDCPTEGRACYAFPEKHPFFALIIGIILVILLAQLVPY